ncbi:unnamed protein product [marine sediment metagenome]|uniref:Uncharacterized protein n=1 Tax=marine sediment metagenome TaxID=412755 RepID=X1HMR1_9ZZZZ
MFSFVTLILAWFILFFVGRSQNLHFIIKTILVWLMLMYIGINIIGYIMRSVVPALSPLSPPDDLREDAKKLFNREIQFNRRADIALSLIFLILTAAYLIAIYHYWNIVLVSSAVLVMIGRLPDLLWEIRTGQRVTKTNMPKGVFSKIGVVIDFLTLPLTWYALYKWVP